MIRRVLILMILLIMWPNKLSNKCLTYYLFRANDFYSETLNEIFNQPD